MKWTVNGQYEKPPKNRPQAIATPSICPCSVLNCSRGNSDQYRRSNRGNVSDNHVSAIFAEKCLMISQYNSANREPLFVPGGSVMRILVPWKPVVLVWGLLSAMIFFGFVASSVLQGKDPFAPGATITQPVAAKTGSTQSGQQPRHANKAAQTPSR